MKDQHVADLEELFTTIAKYRLKLNLEKCVFGIEVGKFLRFLLTERGIEANPEKCDLSEGSATVDEANGRLVQICIRMRGQGTSLFSVFEKKQKIRMDQGM